MGSDSHEPTASYAVNARKAGAVIVVHVGRLHARITQTILSLAIDCLDLVSEPYPPSSCPNPGGHKEGQSRKRERASQYSRKHGAQYANRQSTKGEQVQKLACHLSEPVFSCLVAMVSILSVSWLFGENANKLRMVTSNNKAGWEKRERNSNQKSRKQS